MRRTRTLTSSSATRPRSVPKSVSLLRSTVQAPSASSPHSDRGLTNMANLGYDVILVPAGTVVTASGVGTGIELDDRGEYRGKVLVTAVSGTSPTLVVNYQTSFDNGV